MPPLLAPCPPLHLLPRDKPLTSQRYLFPLFPTHHEHSTRAEIRVFSSHVSPVPRTERLAKQVPEKHLLAEWPKWQALVASQAQSVPLKGPPYMRHCCFLREGWAFQGGTGLQLPLGLDSTFVSLLSTCWEVSELGEALGQCPGQEELSKEDVLSEWELQGLPRGA